MTLDFELKQSSTPKEAVLLFHGMTGSPFELKKFGQYLFSQGYDVYAYCLPGHGDFSDDIYNVTYKDWLETSYEKFEFLSKKYSRIFLSGLCLGAVLCLALAIKYQNKVSGIISLSTTLFLDGWRMPWYSFLLPIALSTILRFYYTYPECEPYGIKNKKTRYIVKKLLDKSNVALDNFPMTCIYELLNLSKYVRKNLEFINQPILIIHSEDDDLTSKKSACLVYDRIFSKNKNIVILNNSYHMVLYDNEKDYVYELSKDFINSVIDSKKTENYAFNNTYLGV